MKNARIVYGIVVGLVFIGYIYTTYFYFLMLFIMSSVFPFIVRLLLQIEISYIQIDFEGSTSSKVGKNIIISSIVKSIHRLLISGTIEYQLVYENTSIKCQKRKQYNTSLDVEQTVETYQHHAVTVAKMLENLPFYKNEPLVKYAREICHYHHERYDGRGYPEGLIGDEIPISAQAVSIVDAYDALISERVYKKAIDGKTALKMIQEGKCGAFNPLLIECLSEIQLSIEEELNKNYLFEQRDYINNKADELIKEKGI